MALNKEFTISRKVNAVDNGLTANANVSVTETVYVKVASVQTAKQTEGDESKFIAVADVSFTSTNISGNKTYSFEYSLNGGNVIAQAYNYLKTLSEFSNAQDA